MQVEFRLPILDIRLRVMTPTVKTYQGSISILIYIFYKYMLTCKSLDHNLGLLMSKPGELQSSLEHLW